MPPYRQATFATITNTSAGDCIRWQDIFCSTLVSLWTQSAASGIPAAQQLFKIHRAILDRWAADAFCIANQSDFVRGALGSCSVYAWPSQADCGFCLLLNYPCAWEFCSLSATTSEHNAAISTAVCAIYSVFRAQPANRVTDVDTNNAGTR